jgi:hypothetical protein
MRIFIGLIEIAGYFGNLKKGFEELGHRVTFVDLSGHSFQYQTASRGSALLRPIRRAAQWAIKSRAVLDVLHRMLRIVVGFPLLIWAIFRYDVFIFTFGSSLLNSFDLPLLKACGKKIIFSFSGSDIRPPYIDGGWMADARSLKVAQGIREARRRKRLLRRIERYADLLLSHPPIGHFHERPFLPVPILGIPVTVPEPPPGVGVGTPSSGRPVRILHSPSNPEAKGTKHIRKAIRKLKDQGRSIDFVEISGQPHAVVLRELAQCDFVVDQLYSDTYMAVFTTEAAFFAKPAVVGSYAWTVLDSAFPPDRRPPVEQCHPDNVLEAIDKLVTDAAYRVELGCRARDYVRRYCTPRQVAAAYVSLIEGNIPKSWLCRPQDIRYLQGAGLSQDRCRQLVRAFIDAGGMAALQLDDKPGLQQDFVEFAAENGAAKT